ncbi:MAG: enoyl-CoA hydratase/isomerase family protein [Candidatus Marinimicrobia bacterium]|nr:enoyl-CoA hydratase/isomerase family protein [Candidatus Neomarinimicrobiota bacterium]
MDLILVKIESDICTLTINRPEQYNALNLDILKEIDSKLDWVLEKTNAGVVIITGNGEKAFIAGADIQAMNNMDVREAELFSKFGQDLTLKMEEFKIPIIAAVNGFALGGGCEFAMACHVRYASENAVFGQPEVGLGLIAGFGGTQRLPRLVGKGLAMELLLSGKNINAQDAYRIGLVNKVFPLNELIPEAEKLAYSILNNAPLAVTATINAVNYGADTDLRDGLMNEQKEFANLFNSNDTKEGLLAFVEKKSPKFTGK